MVTTRRLVIRNLLFTKEGNREQGIGNREQGILGMRFFDLVVQSITEKIRIIGNYLMLLAFMICVRQDI
jgi:hypothetical protein